MILQHTKFLSDTNTFLQIYFHDKNVLINVLDT